jgi:hypothetical protein
MMLTRRSVALSVLLLVGVSAGAPVATAAADTASVTTCSDQLTALSTDVATVPISTGKVEKDEWERAGLVNLVSDATALLVTGKTADALVKLANLLTKVDQLAAANRIAAKSAALLTADIQAASACVSSA